MELTASSPGTGRVSLAAGMALGAGVSFLDDTLPEAQAVTQPDMSPHEAAILPGASAARKPAFELLATFHLGGEEFALPAASVQEVVGYPENMATVPLGPPYLQGIFRVRNHIIPVIDLARLFDPSLSTGRQSGKVAIVHHDDLLIGLLFENTGEILRIRPDQHCPFRYDNPSGTGVIASTIRLSQGERLLRVLHPPGIVRIENIPHVKASQAARTGALDLALQIHAERRPVAAFHVGQAAFAFDVAAIQEIMAVPTLQRSVLASKLCIGRLMFRSNAVGVVDLAQWLDIPKRGTDPHPEQRLIVVRIANGFLGLLVDSVDSIFSIAPSDVLPIPLLSDARAGMIQGCIQRSESTQIVLLDHEAMFTGSELQQISKGHADLYQEGIVLDENRADKDRKMRRQAFVTFSLDQAFAVEISRIREILPFCESVLRPPGVPAFVHGVLRLRENMVTLIDLRQLYDLAQANAPMDRKILVVERGDELFGLLVDSVDSLIAVADNQCKPVSQLMRHRQASCDAVSEMQGLIDLDHEDGSRKTYGIFDVESFLKKLTQTMHTA